MVREHEERTRLLRMVGLFWLVFAIEACSGTADEEYAAALKKLSLCAPTRVAKVEFYSDGGTIGIVIAGGKGTEFQMCLDGRMKEFTPGRTQMPTYVGATHPSKEGAREVDAGTEKEKAILCVLQRWLDSQFTRGKQEALRERGSVLGLTQEEIDAMRVADVTYWLKMPLKYRKGEGE